MTKNDNHFDEERSDLKIKDKFLQKSYHGFNIVIKHVIIYLNQLNTLEIQDMLIKDEKGDSEKMLCKLIGGKLPRTIVKKPCQVKLIMSSS